MTSIPLPTAPARPLWRTAQLLGIALTLALIAALWTQPTASLMLLWDMVIPLLPAVFLVNPLIWRNVCPLATLNDVAAMAPGRRTLDAARLHPAWVLGVVLLFVLVPARRFLFNTNGQALAITVVAVALLALAMGFVVGRRGGFCNSLCPVLPVEKLYGQAPLVPMHGVRCTTCTLCTRVGCIDLAGEKTVAQTIGPERRDAAWLKTGFGSFAAGFPGFIIGYFTTTNTSLGDAFAIYGRILGLAVASWALVGVAASALRVRAAIAMPILGAASLGLYYWFAAPNIAKAYHAPEVAALAIRGLMAVILAWWLARVLPGASARPTTMA